MSEDVFGSPRVPAGERAARPDSGSIGSVTVNRIVSNTAGVRKSAGATETGDTLSHARIRLRGAVDPEAEADSHSASAAGAESGHSDHSTSTVGVVGETTADTVTDPSGTLTQHAEQWAQIPEHTHVVRLLDWETTAEGVTLLTEPTNRGSLADRLCDPDDVIWPAEAVWLTTCLCRGLEHAHGEGVTHHDIDPTTVQFAATDGESWPMPKLGGWGVTRTAREATRGVHETAVGYTTPEELDPGAFGEPDERTDVYRLAAVLYRLVTGHPPWTGSGYEQLRRTLDAVSPTPPSEAAPLPVTALDEPLQTALATDPDDRYDSVTAFREALAATRFPTTETAAAVDDETAAAVDDETGESHTAPETAWTASVEGELGVGYRTVYVADGTGDVTALHAETGEPRWETTVEAYAPDLAEAAAQQGGFGATPATAGVETAPAVAEGAVCLLTDAGVIALDARDGRKLWHRELDTHSSDGLTAVDDETGGDSATLYVPAADAAGGDGAVYALDAATGDTRWERPLDAHDGFGDDTATVPAVDAEVVVVNTEDGVAAFDAATGEPRWRFESYYTRPPTVTDGQVYVGTDDTVYALTVADGTETWRADTEYEVAGSPVVTATADDDPSVCVTVRDEWGGVIAFGPETGDRRWAYELREREETRVPTANAVLAGEALAVPLADELGDSALATELLGLRASDGTELFRHELDATVASATTVVGAATVDNTATAAGETLLVGGSGDDDDERGVSDDHGGVTAVDLPAAADAVGAGEAADSGEETSASETAAGGDGEGETATAAAPADDLRADAETLTAVLREEVGEELDRDYIPDETGWSEEKTERVLPKLEAAGLIAFDEWNGMVDVQLVGDPADVSAADVEAEVESGGTAVDTDSTTGGDSESTAGGDSADGPTDAEVLADVLRAEPGQELDKDFIPDETGWSEAKTDRVLAELEAEGVVELDEWSGMVDVRLVSDPAEEDGGDDGFEDDEDDWF